MQAWYDPGTNANVSTPQIPSPRDEHSSTWPTLRAKRPSLTVKVNVQGYHVLPAMMYTRYSTRDQNKTILLAVVAFHNIRAEIDIILFEVRTDPRVPNT